MRYSYLFESLFDKPKSHHTTYNQGKYIGTRSKSITSTWSNLLIFAKTNRIEEANGKTLLDNIMFTYGSGLGDGSTHQYALPIIVVGPGLGNLLPAST